MQPNPPLLRLELLPQVTSKSGGGFQIYTKSAADRAISKRINLKGRLNSIVRHFSVKMKRRMIMKILLALILAFCASSVSYSQTTEQMKNFRPPKIIFKNVKPRHKRLKAEALNKIVYPLICESDEPIEEIIVDFCPEILGLKQGERGCDNEAQGKLTFSITVNGFPTENSDGSSSVMWIERNKSGSFDRNEYLRFSAARRGSRPPKEGCASKDTQKE